MKNQEKKKQSPLGKVITALIVLSFLNVRILVALIPLCILVGVGWLVLRAFRKPDKENTRTQRNVPLDDCPKPICFHRDKGAHHVVRGRERDPWDLPNREIDPWDRPDIDIRKYQRR